MRVRSQEARLQASRTMVAMSTRKMAKKTAVAHPDSRSGSAADVPVESAFGEVVDLIRVRGSAPTRL